jgi:hypothetical protein
MNEIFMCWPFIIKNAHWVMYEFAYCVETNVFRSQLTNYLPQHYCKRKWLIGTKDNPEFQLHESYMAQRQKYSNARLEDVFHRYIEVCQTLPYYG